MCRVDKEGSSSEVNVMTENKSPLYNEIPISHIQHDFFNESDRNQNLETVFTFNNESLLYAYKLTGEKEEISDDELLESLSDDGELLESFSDNIVIDIINGKIQRCNATKDLKKLWKLVGIWEIAEDAVQEVKGNIQQLGICNMHFHFDQNKLHEEALWNLLGRNLQIPCIWQTYCHLHCHSGKGKPIKTCQKTGLALKLFNNNLSSQSCSSTPIANTLNLFTIKTAIKLMHINIDNNKVSKDLLPEDLHKTSTFLSSVILNTAFKEVNVISHTDQWEWHLENLCKKAVNPCNIWNIAIIDNIDIMARSFPFENIYNTTRQSSHITLQMVFQYMHKTSTFLSSVILNTAFKEVNVISHTDQWEWHLENLCKKAVNPCNIWNIAIIDNIDIMARSFPFENIYNTTRQSSHITLQMVFQYKIFNNIFDKLLFENLLESNYTTNFCVDTIHQKIIAQVEYGCQCKSPNVVILEAGGIPTMNDDIFLSLEMYQNDVGLTTNGKLDVSADEDIFRRMAQYKMMIFEFYLVNGIQVMEYLNLAAALGVQF
ncbi:hypothetical protein Glove_350g161 [Diversispora epigaea]|uniref:Uncharacterized protein n=1 Tax=Diversispora epigaea TaxID=1348612 RepID=A0A397HH72_9GLOM|nr:hypothetical protein Glove_350g161 [Diversispora epigaea]